MRWKPVVLMLVAAGAGLAACGGGADVPEARRSVVPSAGVESSSAASPQWAEPESYSYVLTTGCTRGFVEARYAVQVEGGRVLSATGLNAQAETRPDIAAPTLGEIDAWMRAATGNERRERDPGDGHPVAFGFDPEKMAIDAGQCYQVSEYEPA
ncbi:DUF6174 domain-containing protein [Catenuloplanes japonicus]|uniref:DUF6174 domain-containing protein n=1 Tax=Catenuloplanes japonicus TaxID=33876 RepID=UPI00052514B6|nr:hypothetical protein [Catenuloplanes japonicus]